ncbi:Damage-inducible protein DinB [Hyphomicrobiales bacterium]|nr:Damage-inducible protein DinB [Hyphomicrobiales bacterium]CAH1700559.1 Damage-inducible protein DinB [Hyphomicrobiales bacterium]CAI0344407.1 Damage-inducible protein DinB [Hyphomicrobiales bacterium]
MAEVAGRRGPLSAHFRKMAHNNAWANWRLLSACLQLDDAAFKATRTSFFPSLHETLNHNLMVDLYYIDALERGGLGRQVFERFRPFEAAALFQAQTVADRRLIAVCEGFSDAALGSTVATDRRSGPIEERIDDLLAHLFQHQIHHRGQAHAMLAGTDVAPPQLDEYFLLYDSQQTRVELRRLDLLPPEELS